MTLKGFTSKFLYPPAVIILISVLSRLYKLNDLFSFDYDQQAPANAAYEFFKSGKLSLIGQELSFQGFFVGPFYNWSQIIPYGVCNLLPDCISYFFIAISALTTLIFYLVVNKILGTKIAAISATIWAVSLVSIAQDLGPNTNIYLFLSSVIILFSLHQYFLGKQNYLVLASFIAGLAVVNFNPVYIFTSLVVPAAIIIKKRTNLKTIIICAVAFLINLAPFFVFNLRHNNILLDSITSFYRQNAGTNNSLFQVYNLLVNIQLPFYANFLFQSANFMAIILTLFLITYGIYALKKIGNRFFLILPIWILLTLLGFIFYKGHIPDYYFWQTLLPFILIVAIALKRNIVLFLPVTTLFLYANISALSSYHSNVNYKLKKEAINFILKDSYGESFNVYYDFPQGLNTGYSYLFKAYGKEPIEGAKNLYILTFSNPREFNINKYGSSSFSSKAMKMNNFGYIEVVSIK